MYKTTMILAVVLVSVTASYFVFASSEIGFEKLSGQEKYEFIITQRDFAIDEAVENGDYRCCIDPPCTMCYMEANEWNNHQAGTCACDDLIAQGKEACPQCHRELEGTEEDTAAACGFNN